MPSVRHTRCLLRDTWRRFAPYLTQSLELSLYYSGIASWGWFHNYHYTPRISGTFMGLGDMLFAFELGKYLPFEQLMGVLPPASTDHISLAYQDLMYDANSPILDFYPLKFEQDLSEKKQAWEAIVRIPFIDEQRLLQAMHCE
ncbi:hypothetical protein C8R48DRAFT_622693 [Suillus tomentosus]|nr:hypothetical protein C8R48DRAFT_622693 [Suillus tomentosus]